MDATARQERASALRKIRCAVFVVIIGLLVGGITAFPLQRELEFAAKVRGVEQLTPADASNGFDHWILVVRDGLRESYARFPWVAYGTDWLAFAHIVIAVFFIGPLIDPVRNVWVLKAGVITCLLIIPMALVAGAVRQIPMGWRLIDCSFGIFGLVPLCYALRLTRSLGQHDSGNVTPAFL
jgi:hypothetical protein